MKLAKTREEENANWRLYHSRARFRNNKSTGLLATDKQKGKSQRSMRASKHRDCLFSSASTNTSRWNCSDLDYQMFTMLLESSWCINNVHVSLNITYENDCEYLNEVCFHGCLRLSNQTFISRLTHVTGGLGENGVYVDSTYFKKNIDSSVECHFLHFLFTTQLCTIWSLNSFCSAFLTKPNLWAVIQEIDW